MVYSQGIRLRREFLKAANEEKFTTLEGKLFQTFTTRSLKNVFRTIMRQ